MLFSYLVLFAFLLTTPANLPSLIDLEEMRQPFVLETKKIEIPGYPRAFNPSIIRWQGSLLMNFREIPDLSQPFNSEIGLVWLDEGFNPIGKPQILDTKGPLQIPSRADDARLIKVGERLYIVYSNNVEKEVSKGGFRLFIAEVIQDGESFALRNIECLAKFPGESRAVREKNWVPFDYKGKLHLAYSLTPHLIFRPIFGTGSCKKVVSTLSAVNWEWGELRGGTPGLLEGNEYLAFFHSLKDMLTVHSNNRVIPHYFIGAYTFSRKPPFEIKKISPEPIVGKGFYKGPYYKPIWRSLRVVFPGGYLSEENFIWIVYGRQDHELWVVKLDKHGLLDSLVEVGEGH